MIIFRTGIAGITTVSYDICYVPYDYSCLLQESASQREGASCFNHRLQPNALKDLKLKALPAAGVQTNNLQNILLI